MDTSQNITKLGLIITEDAEHWENGKLLGNLISERIKSFDNTENVQIDIFLAFLGSLPERLWDYKGFIISGSHYSVNENFEWIQKLERFVIELVTLDSSIRPKLYGICFGHQLIAKSLGGKVEYAKKYIIGANKISVEPELQKKSYFKEVFNENCTILSIFQSHREEVVVLPPDAVVVASSDTCQYEMLMYGEHILSSQGHPELSTEKLKKYILPRSITNHNLKNGELEKVLLSMENVNTDNLMKMIISFLQISKN
ncbi:uncharacterized protein LOC136093772 [Hydra vulgaris]|uniref:uncharacterized protein LOC136093772 n=1 Tax=Hydra vulgaris TaxID=6087 RepID=UPI0032E9D024